MAIAYDDEEDLVPWLVERMTLEEVEAKHPFLKVERRPPATAKWSSKSRWDEIKSKMADGDELWWYFINESVQHDSVAMSIKNGGIALLRDGKVIDHISLLVV